MKRLFAIVLSLAICASACIFLIAFKPVKKTPRILIFSKTAAFYHQSIPAGISAIQMLAQQNGFICDTTTDSLQFNKKNLRQYKAVVFLNTTGNVLDEAGQKAFEAYIRSGKGYVGIHAAADTEYDWPWYNQLVSAYFKRHPDQQTANLQVVDSGFIATRGLPSVWSIWDEWYYFKDTHWDKVHVLITLDEKSMKEKGEEYHPISWYHEFEGGRSFYTAIGHLDKTFEDSLYLRHLLGGIEYAMGK